MSATIQMRRGTAASATASNPILKEGEWGLETDTTFYKIGDGVTAWNSLPYGGVQGIPGAGEALAIGFISMFSGTWVDNTTMPGWYACIAANSAQGCPDLENTFIKGSAPADVGTTGGSNTHTLDATEIPSHTHSIAHDHGAATTGSHYHGGSTGWRNSESAMNYYGAYATVSGSTTPATDTAQTIYIGKTSTNSVSVNLPAYAGNSDGGTGGGLAHNNEPQYYKLIYIRKCS